MGGISREIIDRIRDEADIVGVISNYIPLKRQGTGYVALCPFHPDKEPSFSVNPKRNTYHCFGCGAGGDVISFVRQVNGLNFIEAMRDLCNKYGVALELDAAEIRKYNFRNQLYSIYKDAAEFYHKNLFASLSENKQALEYISDRVSKESIENWKLGYASQGGLLSYLRKKGYDLELLLKSGLISESSTYDGEVYEFFRNRILFPITDWKGHIVAFAGRVLDDSLPKYINNADSPIYKKSEILFGIDKALKSIRMNKEAIVVEGYFDTIVAHEYEIDNCVATCGTALTEAMLRHIATFTSKTIVCFDADAAGWRAMEKMGKASLSEGIPLNIMNLGGGDPDEFLKNKGAQAFRGLAEKSTNLFEFMVQMKKIGDIKDPSEKYGVVRELYEIIDSARNPLQKSLWFRELADRLSISYEEILIDYCNHLKQIKGFAPRKESAEEYVLGFLATNPYYRRNAKEMFIKEDFEDPIFGWFFEFLCSGTDIDDVVVKPKQVLEEESLFSKSNRKDILNEFKKYCTELSVVLHEDQLSHLESILIQTKTSDRKVLQLMKREILKRELQVLERDIISAKEKKDIESLNELITAYEKKWGDYRKTEYNSAG